jgi:hypothetical protein
MNTVSVSNRNSIDLAKYLTRSKMFRINIVDKKLNKFIFKYYFLLNFMTSKTMQQNRVSTSELLRCRNYVHFIIG